MKCERCGQDLEPVWVGPGDRVRIEKEEWRVVCDMADLRGGGVMFEQPDKWAVWSTLMFKDAHITTLDGRPVAGFRDPRDERIAELESRVSEGWEGEDILRDVIREQRTAIDTRNARIADLEAAIANNDRDYSLVCEQRDSAEERNAELETQLWDYGQRICNLERKLQAAKITEGDYGMAEVLLRDPHQTLRNSLDIVADRINRRVEKTT